MGGVNNMEIYDLAMEIEKKGKEHYLSLMESTDNQGLKEIFAFLAKEEEKHYRYIEGIKNKTKITLESNNLESVETVFNNLIEKYDGSFTGLLEQIDAYRLAGEFEDKSIEFYKNQLNKHRDPLEKNIFLRLYFEEKKHRLIIDNIIEFVTEFEMEAHSAEHHRGV